MMGKRVLRIPQEISQQVSTTDEFAYLHVIKQHGGCYLYFYKPLRRTGKHHLCCMSETEVCSVYISEEIGEAGGSIYYQGGIIQSGEAGGSIYYQGGIIQSFLLHIWFQISVITSFV
jgi:hypothetical protein